MPIALPRPDELPPGPKRDLVVELHDLYGKAGKPSARIISRKIDLLKLVPASHETVNSALRGKTIPKWDRLRSIFIVLCRMSEQPIDQERELSKFQELWLLMSSVPAEGADVPGEGADVSGEGADVPAEGADVSGEAAEAPAPADQPDVERPPDSTPRTASPLWLARTRATPPGVRGRLPEPAVQFVGRTKIIDDIENRLTRSAGSPFLLYGPIGTGKTQLVAEYVRRYRHNYTVIWWVEADDHVRARESLFLLAQELNLAGPADARRSLPQLLDLLAGSGRYLFVFDGLIHADLREFSRTKAGNVIMTTRNAGWAAGSPHDELEVPDLDDGEAVQLLRKQDPQPTSAQAGSVIDIVGRAPLGLAEACRLRRDQAMSWDDLCAVLADPQNRILSSSGIAASAAIEEALIRRVASDPHASRLLTLLLGFGPSPVWLWMVQAGAGGDVSADVRRIAGDVAGLRRSLGVLVEAGLARTPDGGAWFDIPAIIRLVLRELLPDAYGETARRDVREILVAADPGHPGNPATLDRHRAIAPHVRPAALVECFRPAAYRTINHQIRFLFLAGDFAAACRLGLDAVAALDKQDDLAPDDELVLQIRLGLANALRAGGKYAEADRLTATVMTRVAADPGYPSDHPISLAAARSRGHDLRIAGRYQQAYELDETTSRLHLDVFGPDDPRHRASRYHLSVSRRFLGRFAEAEGEDRADCERLSGQPSGGEHRLSRSVNAVAEDLYGLGRYHEVGELLAPLVQKEAGRELERARRIGGAAMRRLGHLDEASDQLHACYQSCMRNYGPDHELTLAVGMSYGNVLRELGQWDNALHFCRQAVDGYARVVDERNPLVHVAQVNVAAVHLAADDADHALSLLDTACVALRQQLGDGHPFTVLAAVNHAAAATLSKPSSGSSRSIMAYRDARKVFGADHLDTLIAAAGLAADRAMRNENDGPWDSLDEVAAKVRRLLGSAHHLVAKMDSATRVPVDIEPPSA